MDIRKVKKLIELLEDSNIAELEIKEGEESVRISRYGSNPTLVAAPPAIVATHAPPPLASAQPAPETGVDAAGDHPQEDDLPAGHVVSSPMVGTYYASPSPSSPAFVNVGQSVSKGEPLCIIEAMKILNQIDADEAGVIAAVLVENGQPVEYGQALFVIR